MKKLLCLLLILATIFSVVSGTVTGDSSDSGSKANSSSSNNKDSSNGSKNDKNDDSGSTTPPANDNNNENNNDNNNDNNGGQEDDDDTSIIGCLTALLSGYKWSPESFIPTKLRVDYEPNLISSNQQNTNYANFVPVSNIPKNGVGEQWNMVLENLSESQIFFNVLTAVDNVSTASVAAFEAFIDENPSETAHYVYEQGIYSVTIHCTATTINYVLDYTANIPAIRRCCLSGY